MMARNKSDVTLLDKLLNKVIVDDVTDCWLWQGAKNNIGYGMVRDGEKMRTTHRVSYEEHNNIKIPKYTCVCHSCDNYSCINPNHLWLGSRLDSTHDMISKGRQRFWGGGMLGRKQPTTHCPHCNRDIPNNMYARYHGDSCKDK